MNFAFCIIKKLLDLAHEKLANLPDGHAVGINIQGCQPNQGMVIYGGLLCTVCMAIQTAIDLF